MTTIGEMIQGTMFEVAREVGAALDLAGGDDTVLLQSGLDSLGFAMVIALLEERLGYDPFQMMVEPMYPRTLGDLISIYERFQDSGT